MLKLAFSSQFKRDYKLALKRGCDPAKLKEVVGILQAERPLPEKYRDHDLTNSRNYRDMRECHIEPDWLLVYKVYRRTPGKTGRPRGMSSWPGIRRRCACDIVRQGPFAAAEGP